MPRLCEFFALTVGRILDDAEPMCESGETTGAQCVYGHARSPVMVGEPPIAMTSSDEQTQKIMELLREGRSDTRIAKRLGLAVTTFVP